MAAFRPAPCPPAVSMMFLPSAVASPATTTTVPTSTIQCGLSPVMVMARIEANTADVPTMAPARAAPMRPTAKYDRFLPPRKLKVPSIRHQARTN